MWSVERIKERLFYWFEYREFIADYVKVYSGENIRRKRVVHHAPFENLAIENAEFDEAFGQLGDKEQQILVELYMKRGHDEGGMYDGKGINDADIEVSEEEWSEVARIFNLTNWELAEIRNDALNTMLEYLNKGG